MVSGETYSVAYTKPFWHVSNENGELMHGTKEDVLAKGKDMRLHLIFYDGAGRKIDEHDFRVAFLECPKCGCASPKNHFSKEYM